MLIFIDADGCPVIDQTIAVAKAQNISCVIVTDTAHVFKRTDAEIITVSTGADSADFALVNRIKENDLVVTQDYGLAAMCLAKKAFPISQNGLTFTNENIDSLLLSRHTAKKIRQSGKRLKGPKKRTEQQNEEFVKKLKALIEEIRENYK